MQSQSVSAFLPVRTSILRPALRRIAGTAAVWLGIGLVAGACNAPAATPTVVAAMMIAGMIVYTPLGVAAALVGGRWKETLIGATFGLGIGVLCLLLADRPGVQQLPAFGLTFGGLVGSTLFTVTFQLRRLTRALVRLAWQRNRNDRSGPV